MDFVMVALCSFDFRICDDDVKTFECELRSEV